jgi:hypothetical protein
MTHGPKPSRMALQWRVLKSAAYAMVLFSTHALGQDSQSKPQMKCEAGPVVKSFGSEQWLAYSCDDNRSLVIVAAPGNPAAPFYFTFFHHDDGYHLEGEGTGNKDTTNAAFNELKALTPGDIDALVAQTRRR